MHLTCGFLSETNPLFIPVLTIRNIDCCFEMLEKKMNIFVLLSQCFKTLLSHDLFSHDRHQKKKKTGDFQFSSLSYDSHCKVSKEKWKFLYFLDFWNLGKTLSLPKASISHSLCNQYTSWISCWTWLERLRALSLDFLGRNVLTTEGAVATVTFSSTSIYRNKHNHLR